MRHYLDRKVIRMIPAPRHATANGATSSARTYGIGTLETHKFGLVDTAGWDVAIITVRKSSGTACKSSWRIGEQSATGTLYASATVVAVPGASTVTVDASLAASN